MEENNKETGKDLGDAEIYELGFHIVPTVPEEHIALEASKIQKIILDLGGSIIAEEPPRLRPLAYDMRKRVETKYESFSKAYFGWIKFEIDRSVITSLKEQVEKNQNILRFIIVKTVRENTMYTPKMVTMRREDRIEDKKEGEEKPASSEAEIDKSIDELVIT